MSTTVGMLLITTALQATAAQVRISPASVELRVGETIQLSAEALDEDGRVVEAGTVRWFSPNQDLVSVSGTGLITGVERGAGRVIAAVGRARGFVDVTVLQLPVERLTTLSAPTSRLVAGTSTVWSLLGHTAGGEVVDDPDVTITSSNPRVAHVDGTGRIHALAAGRVVLRAVPDGATSAIEAAVEVVEAPDLAYEIRRSSQVARTGDVVRFRVDVSGGSADLQPLWSVSGQGAQIESEGAEGVFVAEAPGEYVVSAMIGEGLARATSIEVAPREYEASISLVGRGVIAEHNSADMWVFEGVDGRDYMYVGTYMYDWMKVFDVTDPASPVLTDSLQFDARRINDVKIHPNARLGVATREGASDRKNGMMLLDLSVPAHPTLLSEYSETLTGGVHNVWIDGEHDLVYAVHNGTSDVHIIDVSDPANPAEVGRWGLEKTSKTLHDVIVQDGYAYLSYWRDGVVTLDVGAGTHGGTPTEPAYVSRYKYPIWNTHTAWRAGRYLFLGDENFPPDWDRTGASPTDARGYIHVIDMTDIDGPREVANYRVPEAGAHNVWVEGDRLYIGYYQAGLRIVDISGELRGNLYEQGREVARFDMRTAESRVPNWPMAFNAQLHKGYLYASDLNSGIWITKFEEAGRIVF